MARSRETYGLAVVLVLLVGAAYYYYSNTRGQGGGLPGVLAADTKFTPLDVREPELRLDLLSKIRNQDYPGSHRNIFVAAPPPPPPRPAGQDAAPSKPKGAPYPQPPPPPPPLQVPVEFFGYASQPHGGRRVAFFTSGDDVLVVAEGDTFLKVYRLVHLNNDTADIEEVSTHRKQTMPMVQSPQQGANP
jgi:hypothetical protein